MYFVSMVQHTVTMDLPKLHLFTTYLLLTFSTFLPSYFPQFSQIFSCIFFKIGLEKYVFFSKKGKKGPVFQYIKTPFKMATKIPADPYTKRSPGHFDGKK
jgi:hypothetical protein